MTDSKILPPYASLTRKQALHLIREAILNRDDILFDYIIGYLNQRMISLEYYPNIPRILGEDHLYTKKIIELNQAVKKNLTSCNCSSCNAFRYSLFNHQVLTSTACPKLLSAIANQIASNKYVPYPFLLAEVVRGNILFTHTKLFIANFNTISCINPNSLLAIFISIDDNVPEATSVHLLDERGEHEIYLKNNKIEKVPFYSENIESLVRNNHLPSKPREWCIQKTSTPKQ